MNAFLRKHRKRNVILLNAMIYLKFYDTKAQFMKTIEDFTPEIQKKIPVYIKQVLEGVFDGGKYSRFNLKDAEEAVYFNYEKCGYKKPVVLVAENIYEQQIMFNYLKSNKSLNKLAYIIYCSKNNLEISKVDDSQLSSQLRSQLDSQLRSQLSSQLRSQLSSQLDSQLFFQLSSQLDSQLDSQLLSQLNSQLYSQLDSQLFFQLSSQLDSQLKKELATYNPSYLFTLNVWSGAFFGWYNFLKEEFNLQLTIDNDFQKFMNHANKSNIYSAIFSEIVCVVCKYPKKVHRDNQNRLHSQHGTTVEWGSLVSPMDCFYWHGVNVPKEWILSPGSITEEVILSETNAEKRRCLREIIGAEEYFKLLGGVNIVDRDIDGQSNEMILYESIENDSIVNGKIQYLSVIDPSTKRKYILYPPNQKSKNVWEAKASTFNNEPIMIRHGDVGLVNLEQMFDRPIYES